MENKLKSESLPKNTLFRRSLPVDTLKGSKYSNMKELRFNANHGVWRVAFAYGPKRQAILLIAGNKAGVNEKKFYKDLIRKADDRFFDFTTP